MQRKYGLASLLIAVLLCFAAPGCRSRGSGGGAESSSAPESTPRQPAQTSAAPAASDSASNQTSDAPTPQKQADNRPTPGPDLVGSSAAFIGWSEELPVVRQEDSLSNGSLSTSFFRMNLDDSLTALDPNTWHGLQKGMPAKNPPGLIQGKALVQGHSAIGNGPLVTLKIDADEHQIDAMQSALQEWNDGKRDANQGFPSVSAVLSIQFAFAGHQPKTLWKDSTTLGVAAGEAGFEYSEPFLSLAVLSPSQKRLYFEIVLAGDNTERHLVIVPEEAK